MKRQLQSFVFLTIVLALFSVEAKAQVSNYNFSSSNGTYTEITGGSILFQGDPFNEIDDDYAAVPIPFSFTFNGTAYTTAYVNSNGAVSFGGGNSEYMYPLEYIDDDSAIVAAFGADLYSGDYPASTITAQTIGTAPNRTLVIQWKNWQSLDESDSSNLNFQIRLNEAGGIAANQSVNFSYGLIYLDEFTDISYLQVGLRGATISDFTNRFSTTGWQSTTAGTDIEDYVETNSSLLPANGQLITYSQVTPLAINLKDISALNVGSSNEILWSSAHEDQGDRYILERSNDGKTFNQLETVAGKGQAADYTYWDNTPYTGVTYYRLQLLNASEKATYSKVVSADMKDNLKNEFAVYPNPAKSYIRINTSGNAGRIIIYDQLGNVVIQSNNTGDSSQVNISSLANGVYTATYDNGARVQQMKFVKQ